MHGLEATIGGGGMRRVSAPEPTVRPTEAERLSYEVFAARLRADREIWRHAMGGDLFVDPAWDMLLDLFITRSEGKRTSVSALCLASCVPSSTALRWIATMERRGLVVRRPDPCDRRRYFVHLTAAALAALHEGLNSAAANWGIALRDDSGMIGLAVQDESRRRRHAG